MAFGSGNEWVICQAGSGSDDDENVLASCRITSQMPGQSFIKDF